MINTYYFICSINDLDTNTEHRKEVFSNFIGTDGYSADIVIYKKKRISEGSHDMAYDMNDLHVAITENQYDLETFCLTGLDPGGSSVFTAAHGGDNGTYQVRRCTRKEYNTYSDSTRIANQEAKRAEQERMTEVLNSKPTEKTASTEQYTMYIN